MDNYSTLSTQAQDVPVENPEDASESMPVVPTVTEQEKELGQMASAEFERRQYDGCAKLLDKLLAARSVDPKVVHNRYVVEYYMSGMRTTDDFMHNLGKVCEMAQVNMDDIETLDDVDQCVIYYNQAVVYYHVKRFGDALAIAEKLYTFQELLDDALSKRILCLLAELYLCTSQPERAVLMINTLEKIVFGKAENEEGEEAQANDLPEDKIEEWRVKLVLYKIQCMLMSRSLKHCKRELKNLGSNSNDVCVIYMKANFEYLRGNLEKSMKVLNSVQPTNSPKRLTEATAAMYYNNLACIHMMMKKHNLGSFYFKKALQENEIMAKELKLETLGHSLSGKPMYSLSMSRHFELLYNTGIQLLHCGKPLPAFDCLIEAVKVYSNNPRLWLRLAECCLMVNKRHNDDDRSLEKRLQVIDGVIGSGINRKLILGTGKGDFRPCTESAAMPVATLEFSSLCLSNALYLLTKLVNAATQTLNEEHGSETVNAQEHLLIPASPSSPMKADEVAHLRCSILANSAYVALLLHDYTMALDYSELLLAQDVLSPAHRYLGKMYRAEAQVYLDKIADAIRNLNTEDVTDISVNAPDDKSGQDQDKDQSEGSEVSGSLLPWIPADVPKAKAFMLYNLSVSYAMRGEFDKAMSNLALSTQTIGTPLPVHVYFLRLYLDLVEGRRKIAQGIIKEHFGHVTPNRI